MNLWGTCLAVSTLRDTVVMDDEIIIESAGEDPNSRLVNSLQVMEGSVMETDSGDATAVLWLKVTSRSTGSHTDVTTHYFAMTEQMGADLAADLIARLS